MEIPNKIICCKHCACPIAHNNVQVIMEHTVLLKPYSEIALHKKPGNTNLMRCGLCKSIVAYKYNGKIHILRDKAYRAIYNKPE